MLPIIREIPPRRPRCRSSFNKGHCSAALWPIKATWLYINCDEFHLLTKIRHPEVRKRASVFFSLQVGPKDLVLEVLIKLIKSKLSHYLNCQRPYLDVPPRRLRLALFGGFGQCKPKNYSLVTPCIAPLPPPWVSHHIPVWRGFIPLRAQGPIHLGTRVTIMKLTT